ncbi:MAG: hypothetical protein M1817_004987 [Caeruleum heppii]|nr:MAG: hypothetical protein M1817_004987 [Caeruleum heppii]
MVVERGVELTSKQPAGTGNIGTDTQQYVDGEIVREATPKDPGTGPVSTGRGGQGNISSPGTKAQHPDGEDVIPEAALRKSSDEPHHIGRGGQGNVHQGPTVIDKGHPGIVDKLKAKLHGSKEVGTDQPK